MFRDGSVSVLGTRVVEVPIQCGPLLVLMPEHCSVCCIFETLVVDQIQHDRQYTYNVAVRWLLNHCREWKNKIYYIFWVCSCSYPACKAYGTILYCNLWPVWICHIYFFFFTVYHKWHIFWKKGIEHKIYALIFSTTLSETFLILRGTKHDSINLHRSSCKLPVISVIF
jgi:hypothetical protein